MRTRHPYLRAFLPYWPHTSIHLSSTCTFAPGETSTVPLTSQIEVQVEVMVMTVIEVMA